MKVSRPVLLTLAILALLATVWNGRAIVASAKSPEGDSTASVDGDTQGGPLLLTPPTSSAAPQEFAIRETSKSASRPAASRSSSNGTRAEKAPAETSNSAARRSPKPKIVTAAAFQEAVPEEIQPPKPVATKSTRGAAAASP